MFLQVQFRQFLLVLPFPVPYSPATIRIVPPDPMTARVPEVLTDLLGLSNAK